MQHNRNTAARTPQPIGASDDACREMADLLGDVLYSRDTRTGHIAYVNRAYEVLWGRSRASLYADPLSFLAAVHPDDRPAVERAHRRAASGESGGLEYRIMRPDGALRWIHDVSYPMSEAGRVVGMARDITSQKQAQQAVYESEERFRQVAMATADAIYDWDTGSDRTWWNDGVRAVFGYAPDELAGGFEAWLERVHPDDRERVRRHSAAIDHGAAGENWNVDYRFERKDGAYAYVMDRGFVLRDGGGAVVRAMGAITDLSARRQSELERDRLHQEKTLLLESTGEGIWGIDGSGNCTFVNGAAARMLGYEVHEVLGKNMHRLVHYRHADGSPYPIEQCPMFQSSRSGHSSRRDDELFWRKDGTAFPVEYASYPIMDGGKAIGSVVTFFDITERRQAEQELVRIGRALQMRNACNELLIRATDEAGLLTEICRLARDIGGYSLAWVGYAQDDSGRSVATVAHAGGASDADLVDAIHVSWSAERADGQGPAGKTMRSGMPTVLEDISAELGHRPWFALAQQRGYHGLACLPLRENGRTFGLLALFSSEVRPVPAEEIELLQALADDLAFGIENIRAQVERRRIQAAVIKMAAGVSAPSDTEFFEQLAHNMADAVGAQAAILVQLHPSSARTARTIAVVMDGAAQPNFDYALAGMPCDQVLAAGAWVEHEQVAERYRDTVLGPFGMQAYVGRRLDNAAGQAVGLLCVLFREPLRQARFIPSTLQIFATRVAAELERRQADARIRKQASLLDKAQDAIMVRAIDHRILFWNKSAERLYGWTAQEAVGRSGEELLCHDTAAFADASRKLGEQGEWSGEFLQRRKDGSMFTVESRWTLVHDDDGLPQSVLCIDTDITRRKEAEREIQHLAFYDPLTQLANRQRLLDRLQDALETSRRARTTGALLFIDLDNFKALNDTLGHDKGDQLLQQVGQRLNRCVRNADLVARLGGDEFVVMLQGLSRNAGNAAAAAKAMGERILAALAEPYQLGEHGQLSTPSIGATIFHEHDTDVGELLKRADLAMYQAKMAGKNTMRFFDPDMQKVVLARAALEADFRLALQDSQLVLHYQPQVRLDGRVIGAEALVRWQHPQRGMVSPSEFIPLAEETGLVLPMGRWVLETACAQLVAWSRLPHSAHLTLAVNVSARQFGQPDFVAQVSAVLARAGADPRKLKLELTESLLVENVDETVEKMSALKALGVGFSLDDFGTGYSSLAYLKRLPLDQLKIDQSFVRDVLTDANDAAIARTIVALGQSLGLAVIAEGVETEAQRDFLARHHCDAYQGYLYSRPLPALQFDAFIAQPMAAG
jgi:diguanylate cyclase (GGDEF)-like protein/PAS domain S-box-containing protein